MRKLERRSTPLWPRRASPNLRSLTKAQERIAKLEKDVGALPKTRYDYKKLIDQRRELLTEVNEARRRKSRLVEDAARELTVRVGERVRVRVDPLSDRSRLHELLKKAVEGQNVRNDQLEMLAQAAPQKVANALRDGPSALEELGAGWSTAGKLSNLGHSTIRSIEEAPTPDRVQIEIDLGAPDRENWTPVDKASPGRRATAMLALALSSGTEPLVIDQPQDDLDNRYIYDEVVRVLARAAESRQIIVVTHNTNLPVLGDAELVLALDAKADRARPLACGGLEEPGVIWYVRHILEGGDAAFDARSRRYLASGQLPPE